MFTWVGSQFDVVLNNYVLGVVSRLVAGLVPIALVCMTIWVALYGWAVLRNEVSETVPVFMWKVFKISLVLAFALQSGFYMTNVWETANALATGVAATFQSESADPGAVTSPYALLDAFNDQASVLVIDLLREASITRLDLVFAAVVCSIGNVLFICIALFVISLAKVFLTFSIAVGPLFILCLAWKPTQRFFDSWLSMVLNAVVLTWFAFFALGLSIYMGQSIVQVIQTHGGFSGPNFNVVTESLKYCIVMILMSIICFQAPSLAAGFTGGAVMQQGIQMIQNAMVAGGLRSPNPSPGGGDAGGSIRKGAGPAYTAGRMTGAAAAAAARYASTVTSRGGSSAAAKAAEHASTSSPIKPSWMRDSK